MPWESFPGTSAGAMEGSGARKLLFHSTESTPGKSLDNILNWWRQSGSWPTYTVDIMERRIVKHLPHDQAAKALKNEAGGVQTNKSGTILIQVEICGRADNVEFGSAEDWEWFGREFVGVICRQESIPIRSTVRWVDYPASYGQGASQRLSDVAWQNYSGILGHQHAPENDHGDPGAIPIQRIVDAALTTPGNEDDMVTDADVERIAKRAAQLTAERMNPTLAADLRRVVTDNANRVLELLTKVDKHGSTLEVDGKGGARWAFTRQIEDIAGRVKDIADAVRKP